MDGLPKQGGAACGQALKTIIIWAALIAMFIGIQFRWSGPEMATFLATHNLATKELATA